MSTKHPIGDVPLNVVEVDRGTLISRREAMRCGLAGAAGLLLAGRQVTGSRRARRPAAESQVGHPDLGCRAVPRTWIPSIRSRTRGNDYCGPLIKPIPTNVDGIRIGELLPLLAKQADKYSIIRSMTHGNNGHETAAYLTQTGRRPGDRLVYPCAGAVVSLFKGYDAGYKGLLPPYVVLTQSQGRFSEAGFLGPRYLPFATGGDPSQPVFMRGRRRLPRHLRPTAEGSPRPAPQARHVRPQPPRQRGAGNVLRIGGAGLRHDRGRRRQGV